MARVYAVYQDIFFWFQTTLMDMSYFYASDSTDTTGLGRYGVTVAKGLGLTFRGWGDIFYNIYLKGCVIDGILYGDTTNLIVSVKPGEGDDLPEDFILLQNYPNPFNPSTTISFELLKYSTVSLIIYDILGNEILKLIDNRELNAGEHKVIWDGLKENERKAASGIYFYRLITNNQVLSRSMILLK
jgi:hypothetical protein